MVNNQRYSLFWSLVDKLFNDEKNDWFEAITLLIYNSENGKFFKNEICALLTFNELYFIDVDFKKKCQRCQGRNDKWLSRDQIC